MTFTQAMEVVTWGFEVLGVIVLVAGSVLAVSAFLMEASRGEAAAGYVTLRRHLGRSIILGLEVLIVADIVKTITISTTLESAATLGIIVLVRTFLSFSLEVELDGVVPWHRADRGVPSEVA